MHGLTIVEATRRMREGGLTATELVKTSLRQMDKLEPSLKAWVTIDRERALETAANRDQATRGSEASRRLLEGVPIGVKDIFHVAGLPTGAGSSIYHDFMPEEDATCVARLKEAGAIILGKTVTTEFAFVDPPPTRNPWDPHVTPGGSSSGSAVSVASLMVPAALGSQTAGSTLRPAAYNGIVGLKPTYGRISRAGLFPFAWTLDTVGILTRTVEDAALLLQAMAGPDPRDPLSAQAPVSDYASEMERHAGSPPRIGVLRDSFLERAAPEVVEYTTKVLETLRAAGASVLDVTFPEGFERAMVTHRTVMATEVAAVHQETFATRAHDYGAKIRAFIEEGTHISGVDYLQAQRYRRRFGTMVRRLFERCDVLLTPATPAPAPRDLSTTGDPSFQIPWTFAGVPAMVIPAGLSRGGLPLGVQLVAPPFAEGILLGAGKWCADRAGVALVPPVAI